jgi:hypothetical protein
MNENSKTDKLETLIDFYFSERKIWEDKLKPLFEKVRGNAYTLIILQSDFLTIRQDVLEEINVSLTELAKYNIQLKKKSAERMKHWAHGSGLKYTAKEYITLIEGDMTDLLAEKELLESHVEFLRDCKVNCDQIGYSIKNRVELLNYTRD